MNTTKQNKSISARKRYRRMFFYLIEKHMQNFRHFWRKKNFTWKSHLRPSCTKPFNFLATKIVLAKRASDRWFALTRHFWHSPGRAGECLSHTLCICSNIKGWYLANFSCFLRDCSQPSVFSYFYLIFEHPDRIAGGLAFSFACNMHK